MTRSASAWSGSAIGAPTSRATSTACPAPSSPTAATSTRPTWPRRAACTRSTVVTDDYAQLLADDALDADRRRHLGADPLRRSARRRSRPGKHTFIEKPIALKAADAQDLLDTAEEYGVKLMVGHLLEYHPAVAKMKELIDSGELGKVFYAYANRLNLGKVRTDENALWSFGPHDISVLNYLTGDEPVEVSARGECYLQDDVEDVVFGYIKYKSGVVGHLHVSWLDPHKSRKITVVGEKKMVVFDDMESRAQDHRLRQGRHHDAHQVRDLRRVRHPALRRHPHPQDRQRRAAAPRVPALRRLHRATTSSRAATAATRSTSSRCSTPWRSACARAAAP